MDETCCRLKDRWAYRYRAIHQDGEVMDVHFSERRHARAAESFYRRAIDEAGVQPTRVTTDKVKCYPPAIKFTLPDVEHRSSKYLNKGLERGHGHLGQPLQPVLGVVSVGLLAATLWLRVRSLRSACPACTVRG